MNCPRCQTVDLSERERDGLLVDACASCRGIWLDRGELEKLISRATRELEELSARHDDSPSRSLRHDDDVLPSRSFRHDDDARGDHRDPKRKRRWFESFGDIFD